MSYFNALIRMTDKRNTLQRESARDAKRALFEHDALDADLFVHDESEIDDMREHATRYAIAH